ELQNLIERAVIATTGRTLQMPVTDQGAHRLAPPVRTLAEVERDHIVATLHATNWVIGGWNGAAAELGLCRTTLISSMQRLGIGTRSGAITFRAVDVPADGRTSYEPPCTERLN